MSEDLSAQIAADAAGPSYVAADGVAVTKRNVREVIEADRYLGEKAARKKNRLGIHILKLIPHGM